MWTRTVGVAALLLSWGSTPAGQEAAPRKPVRVEREYIRPRIQQTWFELVRASDAVVEVVPIAAAGGEAHYYGTYKSVVTAYSVSVSRVVTAGHHPGLAPGRRILVLMPGGRVDRGAYVQHVIVEGAEPLDPACTYIVALRWQPELEAWRPVSYHESVFEVQPDGRVRSFGLGPLAREVHGASRELLLDRLHVAAGAR